MITDRRADARRLIHWIDRHRPEESLRRMVLDGPTADRITIDGCHGNLHRIGANAVGREINVIEKPLDVLEVRFRRPGDRNLGHK